MRKPLITLARMAILTAVTAGVATAMAQSPKSRSGKGKVQEVNFEEMTMKGTIRNPEGTFLVQKKGLKFLPLYQVQKDMDSKIRDSEPSEVLNTAGRTK